MYVRILVLVLVLVLDEVEGALQTAVDYVWANTYVKYIPSLHISLPPTKARNTGSGFLIASQHSSGGYKVRNRNSA